MRSCASLTLGQRLILQLMQRHGGSPNRTCLMKWLFLLRQETAWGISSSPYHFLPYKYGAFSFQAFRDVTKLSDLGVVESGDTGLRASTTDAPDLPKSAVAAVDSILGRYGSHSAEELLRHTYQAYPWYAILSERTDLVGARPQRPVAWPAVYTIGYAGTTIDGLLDSLLRKGIAAVADVRAVPFSRRYGFHGSTLARHLPELGMEYIGRPELGIPTEDRQGISDEASRVGLLQRYRTRLLESQMDDVARLADETRKQPTVLLCVESDPLECHRSQLAEVVADVSNLPVCHL